MLPPGKNLPKTGDDFLNREYLHFLDLGACLYKPQLFVKGFGIHAYPQLQLPKYQLNFIKLRKEPIMEQSISCGVQGIGKRAAPVITAVFP